MHVIRRRLLAGLVSATLAFPIAVIAQAQPQPSPQPSQPKAGQQKQQPQQPQQGASAEMKLPSEPKLFAERLSMLNKDEIEVGQLAQKQASDPKVKEYARKLVEEHQQQQKALTELAAKKNWKLGEGKPIDAVDQKVVQADKADMDKLRALQGPAFDSAFLSSMVADHDHALRMVEAAQQQYQDPELKRSLGETRTHLQDHWQQAYRLLGETKPTGS